MQRDPEEYLARQKAKEEEERLEKSRYQRRYGSDKRSEKDVTKRRSYIPPHSVDEEAQRAAREYRQKRRSLNLKSEHTDSSKTSIPGNQNQQGNEKKSHDKQLKVSVDTTDAFNPESASSPRSSNKGATSPRSATSPPRPSTKRKAAPPPPVSTSAASSTPSVAPVSPSASATKSCASPPVKQAATEVLSTKPVPQPRSPHSKIPKPVTNQESQNSKPSTPQKSPEPSSPVSGENKSSLSPEILQPNRPPRRKKKSEENKSFLHESFEKEQNRKSKEIAVNVDLKENTVITTRESTVSQSKIDHTLPEPDSYNDNEDSLLDTIIKELPAFQTEKQIKGSEIKPKLETTAEILPLNETVEEVIIPNKDSGVESEIKPVKIDKPKGRLIESTVISKIEFTDREKESESLNTIDSDDEREVIITSGIKAFIDSKTPEDSKEPDSYLDHIKPEACNKRGEDLKQAFEKIIALPEKERLKDTKDTISIASDISVSSTGSEAPPLPESAPPPLPCPGVTYLHPSPSLTDVSEMIEPKETEKVKFGEEFEPLQAEKVEISEVIKPEETLKVETIPVMSEVIPEVTEKASPREVVSPISDLKASMFSMRVTSPTRDIGGEVQTNGELTVDTMERNVESDSDMSDGEELVSVTGTFTPGKMLIKL